MTTDDEDSVNVMVAIFLLYLRLRVYLRLMQLLFVVALVWISVVYVLIGLFKVLQFFLLRIVENPKGSIIALSALLTSIGAIVKILMNKPE